MLWKKKTYVLNLTEKPFLRKKNQVLVVSRNGIHQTKAISKIQ